MRAFRNRLEGALFGGALGDSLGSAFEGTDAPRVDLVSGPLRITDDTQLTLATCEALSESREISPERIAARFLAWYRKGRLTGLGASTWKALRDLQAGAHWALAGRTGEYAAGNGAAMRIAPLAFRLDPISDAGRRTIRDVASITHRNEHAYVGALAVAYAVRLAATHAWTPDLSLPELVAEELPDTLVRDRLLEFAHLPENTTPAELAARFGASGFVAESVPLAIFAAQAVARRGFLPTVKAVVAAGGDTDTNASITGQIAGAWAGASALPVDRLQVLPEFEQLAEVVERFVDCAGQGV